MVAQAQAAKDFRAAFQQAQTQAFFQAVVAVPLKQEILMGMEKEATAQFLITAVRQ
jgi:hypothetical protein